jgi:hypothetical protein
MESLRASLSRSTSDASSSLSEPSSVSASPVMSWSMARACLRLGGNRPRGGKRAVEPVPVPAGFASSREALLALDRLDLLKGDRFNVEAFGSNRLEWRERVISWVRSKRRNCQNEMSDVESDAEVAQLDERAYEDDKRVVTASTAEADALSNAG